MKKRITRMSGVLLAALLFVGSSMTAFAIVPPEVEATAEDVATQTSDLTNRVAEDNADPNPFTVPGNGEVVDSASSKDGKEFYIIETPDGNLFYLIIDTQREQENVYFTSFVAEEELLAFVQEQEAAKASNSSSGSGIDEGSIFGATKEVTIEEEETPQAVAPKETSSGGSNILLYILVGAVAAAAGYYFKIYKPKKEQAAYAVDDEFEDDNDIMNESSSFDKGDFGDDDEML